MKRNKIIPVICYSIALIMMVAGIYTILMYKSGDDDYEALLKHYITDESEDSGRERTESEIQAKEDEGIYLPDIDHAGLYAENNDYIGWIRYEAAGIDYPVVKSTDNAFYLHRNFHKSYEFHGCIFIDSANNENLLDPNTIIYGHNMRNGSMFGSLSRLQRQSRLDENDTFYIYRADGAYEYKVFSVRTVSVNSDCYTLFTDRDELFAKWITSMMNASADASKKTMLSAEDSIVTLSTCTGNSSTRLVVQAYLNKVYVLPAETEANTKNI